jgi:hypothetical protein
MNTDIEERKKVIEITYWMEWQKTAVCNICSWWDELDPVRGVGACALMSFGARIKNSGKDLTYKEDKCIIPLIAEKPSHDI